MKYDLYIKVKPSSVYCSPLLKRSPGHPKDINFSCYYIFYTYSNQNNLLAGVAINLLKNIHLFLTLLKEEEKTFCLKFKTVRKK